MTSYRLQVSTKMRRGFKPMGTAGSQQISFVWKKAKRGKTYYVRVAATSAAGKGPWSKPVKVRVR